MASPANPANVLPRKGKISPGRPSDLLQSSVYWNVSRRVQYRSQLPSIPLEYRKLCARGSALNRDTKLRGKGKPVRKEDSFQGSWAKGMRVKGVRGSLERNRGLALKTGST